MKINHRGTCALLVSSIANAAEIKVISTQATEEAYKELVAQFEKATGPQGHDVLFRHDQRREEARRRRAVRPRHHVGACDRRADQARQGRRRQQASISPSRAPGSRCSKGAPKPDIGSADAFKTTLLAAKSIGYSTGPSGVYMLSVFEKLGIADEVKPKLKQTPSGVFVGTLIASGETEIGFQQISELVHFAGIDYVGPLPRRPAAHDHVLDRHPHRGEARRGGQGAGQAPHRAGRRAGHQEARPGAGLNASGGSP